MRLKSTKNIFRNKSQTITDLLLKSDQQNDREERSLNKIHGAILRTKKQSTLDNTYQNLSSLLKEMGYYPPDEADKEKMLSHIRHFKRKNSYLKYAAIHQSIVSYCVNFEDYVRRVILKYYEEDIRRLASSKESMKNEEIVEVITRGDNLHRSLAEKVVDSLMFGSVESWCAVLNKVGMDINLSQEVKEAFLVRNCLVHNDRRVSSFLAYAFPKKYTLRRSLYLTVGDALLFRDGLYKLMLYIASEYDRLFPDNKGSWVRND